MNDTSGLGKLIRDARLRRGWTQKDLGDRLGVEKSYVSAIETGLRRWPQEYISDLARHLGLSQVDMAVAAGIIDHPTDMATAPMVDPRLSELAALLEGVDEPAVWDAVKLVLEGGQSRRRSQVMSFHEMAR